MTEFDAPGADETFAEGINANGFPLSTYVTPTDPTGSGIWKSTDGGKTWRNTTYGPTGIWLATSFPSLAISSVWLARPTICPTRSTLVTGFSTA